MKGSEVGIGTRDQGWDFLGRRDAEIRGWAIRMRPRDPQKSAVINAAAFLFLLLHHLSPHRHQISLRFPFF